MRSGTSLSCQPNHSTTSSGVPSDSTIRSAFAAPNERLTCLSTARSESASINSMVAFAAFAALAFRLGYVQLWSGDELAAKAEDSWRRNIPFSAKRGA